jgi:Domain of unknown function (DUF4386)
MEKKANTFKRTAHLAGLLYLIWVLTGIYGIMYVPSKTIVEGNAVATANKILANEFIFRTGVINDIISATIWVLIALTLYRLFREVNERQAKLLVALVLVQIPVVFTVQALNITSLMIFKGEVLGSFESNQRLDLAMLFLTLNDHVNMVLVMFWGLWLLPFGQLVYKSGFIPRILGIFLILNGIAFILYCFTSLFLSDYQALFFKLATPIWTLGEISIMLWLLIKGVKETDRKLT